MVEWLGEMRNGRTERIEKGSRGRIEIEIDKRELRRQFEEDEVLKETKKQFHMDK